MTSVLELKNHQSENKVKYFFQVMDCYIQARDICRQLCSLFYGFSFELILLNLDAAILEYFEDDSSFQNPSECEKLPLNPCVYEKEFDLLTFHYLSASKVNRLQADIHDLYSYAEDSSKVRDEYIEKFKVCNENLKQVSQQLQTIKEEFKVYKQNMEEKYIKKYIEKISMKFELMISSDKPSQKISTYFANILDKITVFKPSKHFKLIDLSLIGMNILLGFENNIRIRKLSRFESKNCKEPIIDFLYKLKDKFPFSKSNDNSSLSSNYKNECNTDSNDTMDVFDKIMEFITQNKFKPSKKLIKEYSESKLNEALGIPTFEVLNKYTGITKEVYEVIKKRYNARPRFIYYFNPDYEIRSEKKINYLGISFIAVGHFLKEMKNDVFQRIGACTTVNATGRMVQGYYNKNNISYFGRDFCTNGDYYIGQWKNGNWNGEGTLDTTDGWKYTGHFENSKRNGIFKCCKNGKEETREYKDDKLVI